MEYIEQGCTVNSFGEIAVDVDNFYKNNYAESIPYDLDLFCTDVRKIREKYDHEYWLLKEAVEEEFEDILSNIDQRDGNCNLIPIYSSLKNFREIAIKTEWLHSLEMKLITNISIAEEEGKL